MASEQQSNPTPEGLMPREEILALLQEHLSGGEPNACADPEPFRISDCMAVWNDLVDHRDDFFDYVRAVAMFFTCTISEQEIERLYKTKAIVSDLLDILAERAPRRELRPRIIFCKPCMPAAVFGELVRAATAIKGHAVKVAPSTRLNAVLDRVELSKLLVLAGYHFPQIQESVKKIERPRSFDIDTLSLYLMSGLGVVAMLIALAWLMDGHIVLPLLLLILLWLAEPLGRTVVLRIEKLVDKAKGLFVDRIKTFHDLVDYLLAQGGASYMASTQKSTTV